MATINRTPIGRHQHPNGYGASVIADPRPGREGRYELLVVKRCPGQDYRDEWPACYTTPLGPDVRAGLDADQAWALIKEIRQLPAAETETESVNLDALSMMLRPAQNATDLPPVVEAALLVVPDLIAEVERLRAELELSEAGNAVLMDKLDRHRETSQEAVANVLQARLSWPQAEACARDIVNAGLIP